MNRQLRTQGFSVIELTVGLVLVGAVLLAFAGVMNVMQKSSATTNQHSEAQQNVRTAIDFITENLRAAGSDVEAYNGQTIIAHAGPYQVVFNGDFDRDETIQGEAPLGAIAADQSPSTYPSGGATLYAPTRNYDSGAETIVFTLDSDQDGVVTTADRGDEDEEDIENDHLYVLKRYTQGYAAGSSNDVRESNVSLVRGPVAYPDGELPQPLFQYYYNHDDSKTTPDLLWGDDSPQDGELDAAEIAAMVPVPDSLLHSVRRIKVSVVGESLKRNPNMSENEGFVQVQMSSQVYVRNVDIREASLVYGVVWYDANGDGKKNNGENGIPKVAITLQGSGRRTVTDGFGVYTIPVSPGSFIVTETDPSGYTSSTANEVTVALEPGQKIEVNFGDTSSFQFGFISGHVYDDVDEDTYRGFSEAGIPGVTLQLDNEMQAKTNDDGYYRFTVPLGKYTVEEFDLEGYGSTTPNTLVATLVAQGDSVVADFGDIVGDSFGTLRGWVYLDDDQDGERDFGEKGLSDVSISLSNGDHTVTDGLGYYELDLDPGKYDVYELDPDDHTSSTPNLVEDVVIVADSTVTVSFGDMPIGDLDFIEIFVGDTDRPLSVSATDLGEDLNRDVDIVLGTPTTVGPGNVFVFRNDWQSASTQLHDLFDSAPTYVRNAGSDVNTIETFDFDNDFRNDVFTGLSSRAGNNAVIWLNQVKGGLNNSPDVIWTSGYNASITCSRLVDLNHDGFIDMVVGHEGTFGDNTGSVEIMMGYGYGYFYPSQIITYYADGQQLGAVSDIDVGDMDRDGDLDIVVASNTGPYWGHVDIFNNEYDGYWFTWSQRYLAKGEVTKVDAVELFDAHGGTDFLVGVKEAPAAGGMHVWLNRGGSFGRTDTTGFDFDAYTTPNAPDEYIDTGGEGLVVTAAYLDGDIFADIIIGTRSSLFYTGDLFLIRRTAQETTVENIKVNIAGEVVAVDFGDFNKDGFIDIVTTTKTSDNSGKLAVYFTDSGQVAP